MKLDSSKSVSLQLDSLIAQSKQVTADLLTVRGEVKRLVELEVKKDMRSIPEQRLFLVLEEVHSLSDGIHELWRKSKSVYERQAQLILTDGGDQ